MRRASWLAGAWLLLSAAVLASSGTALEVVLPEARNLLADGTQARAQRMPLLLVFTARDCPYCERLKAEVLRPMIFSRQFEGAVLLREVRREGGAMTDLDGAPTSGPALASRYRVRVVPTMLWVDGTGRPLLEPVIGYNTPELFYQRFEMAMQQALERARHCGG